MFNHSRRRGTLLASEPAGQNVLNGAAEVVTQVAEVATLGSVVAFP